MCEVFGRIIGVVDIPLKAVPQENIIYLDIQLQNLQTLLLPGPVRAVMTDSLLDGIHDLVLEWHQEGILGHQQLDKLFRREIWFVYIPAEHLFVFLTVGLQLEVDGDQLLLELEWPLLFGA